MPAVYPVGKRIDHYEILRLLGRGGMSQVYLARDTRTLQEVVLKVPRDEVVGDVATFERFRREEEISRRFPHPALPRLLYVGDEGNAHYLVLEYVPGRTLREVLETSAPAPLPQEEAIRIILQVGEALAYCHAHGAIHRDLKPENILLRHNGDIALIDFGIALLAGARRVTWGSLSALVGTPDYMAPEQVKGQRGSVRSDVYAVGMVLYELLCGRLPFDGDNAFAIMNQHLSSDPPSILQFVPALSPALATVVMRSIRRDPSKRYGSLDAMMRDLLHLDAVRPEAYTPDAPRLGRTQRQALVAVLVTLALCVLIIAFGLLAQYAHAVLR